MVEGQLTQHDRHDVIEIAGVYCGGSWRNTARHHPDEGGAAIWLPDERHALSLVAVVCGFKDVQVTEQRGSEQRKSLRSEPDSNLLRPVVGTRRCGKRPLRRRIERGERMRQYNEEREELLGDYVSHPGRFPSRCPGWFTDGPRGAA